MSNIKLYPTLPSAPEDATFQDRYHIATVQNEFSELIKLKSKFHEKYKKYTKLVDKLLIVNASSSALSIGTGIGMIATTATFVGIPVGAALGSVSLASSISTGITSALIKKYKKKQSRNYKLYDAITSAIAVFETTISECLTQGTLINEKEFKRIQGVYFNTLKHITDIDNRLKTVEQDEFKKTMTEEIQNLKQLIKNSS